MRNLSKIIRQAKPKTERKQIITHLTITHHASLDSRLVRRQQAVYDGQLGLQLGDFTVQATDRGKHGVLLVPVIQEQVVASEISDISLEEFKASLQIGFLMFKPHTLKQRLLVLFNFFDCGETTCNKLLKNQQLVEKRIPRDNTTKPPTKHI
jgi:hypothetical protein